MIVLGVINPNILQFLPHSRTFAFANLDVSSETPSPKSMPFIVVILLKTSV